MVRDRDAGRRPRRVGVLAAAGLMAAAGLLAVGCAGSRQTTRNGFDMPYPPGEAPKAEDIYHLPTGLKLSFGGAMDMISGSRLVCVGENHDNIHAHRVELAIIRELSRRFPGRVAIGMEMFRVPQQEALDRWTAGELSEPDFLRAVKWYDGGWGSDFGYYRDILDFARDNRIDVVALNPSRELEREVKRSGLDNLPETLREQLPAIGEPDPYQRLALKAVYGDHVPSEGAFESFYRTQILWEESMAERVTGYLAGPRGGGKVMVTLTGGWHVQYGFGIPRKVVRRMPLPYTIVLPQEVDVPEERTDRMMDVDIPEVPLLRADFVWMVPYEDLEKSRARMGVVLGEDNDALIVKAVTEGSPAAKAGIAAGDEIVSIDGTPVRDMTDLRSAMGRKRLGDRGTVVVRREGSERALDLEFTELPGTPKRR